MTASRATKLPRAAACIAVLVLGVASSAAAQVPAWLRHVMDDSAGTILAGSLSPDERWLVYTRDISQQESEVSVRSMTTGESRRLLDLKGQHRYIQFSPTGDRVIFTSSIPRRDPSDAEMYMMVAPFDARTGTLTGAPRQISFDPIIQQPRFRPAISPDGSQVSYVDGNTTALKVVPITGGNTRTLFTPSRRLIPTAPSNLSWTEDGSTVRYTILEGPDQFSYYRISASGGTPTPSASSGMPLPGGRVFARIGRARGKPSYLNFFDSEGRQVGNVAFPSKVGGGLPTLSPDGKYIVFTSFPSLADIRIVPTAGGPIRQTVVSTGYDWPIGWTSDSRLAISTSDGNGSGVYRGSTTDGRVAMRTPIPASSGSGLAVIGSTVIERPGGRDQPWFEAVTLPDGARRRLVEGVYDRGCCRAPGGAYAASGDEFFYTRRINGRIEIRGITLTGRDRLVAELPASALGVDKAVFGDRVAYTETVGDSVRLLVKSGRSSPIRLATFTRTQGVSEAVWSWDGRRLAVNVNPRVDIYSFDASGKPTNGPTQLTLPFVYQYELMWLPDGSGMTMVAQPRDAPESHIALVSLSDPSRPVVLTRDDPLNKWGHSLSPDGKLVAYSAERNGAGAIWLIDLVKALEEARRR